MATSIKQIKDLNNTLHDLDNRSVTLTSTSGTLTTDQFNLLQESNQNYILYNNGLYRRVYNNGTDQVIFHRIGPSAKVAQYFTINPTNRSYSYTSSDISGDVSGSGTNGSLVKWSGNKTVTDGPAFGSDTTKFLRNDGTWSTPDSGTDSKTTQTSISTNNNYPVLLKHSANATEETDAVNATNLTSGTAVSINPSTGNINAVKLNGATIGSSPKFTDTTYTFTGGTNKFTVTPAVGTAQDVTVTPSITNNITGSGTSGYLTKFNGANTITNGPALGSDATKYLNNKGEWAVPPNDKGVTSITIETSAPLSGGSSTAVTTTGSWTLSISEATTSAAGSMSSSDKTKLDGIATGAEVNQNAFSNIAIGSTTIAADAKTDTLTLVAGSNVTLTPDATNDKITIAATDTNTTYSLTQNSSDGHKITLTPSSGTAQTITIPDNNTTYSAGTGLSLSGTTFNHSNSVTAGTAGTSSATSGSTLAVPYVTYDAQGHVTASGTHTHTVTGFSTTDTKNTAGSTDTSSKIFLVGATSQAANPQTYSDNQVYVTNGQLDANVVRIAENVSLVYDSTNKCLNFNFL